MDSERIEMRVEQVLASWLIFAVLFAVAWAIDTFGWVEGLVGLAGLFQALLLGCRFCGIERRAPIA